MSANGGSRKDRNVCGVESKRGIEVKFWGVIMDLRTVTLMLAIGSFLFGLLLMIFKLNKSNPQNVPFWIQAKMLQGTGSLMLYDKPGTFDDVTMLANVFLLLGCAYEAWAVRILSGQPVKKRLRILTSVGIILACLIAIFWVEPYRRGLFFLFQSTFYFLPSVFLFRNADMTFSLKFFLAVSYCITGLIFLFTAVACFGFLADALNLDINAILGIVPGVSFCIFLISGFIMLMLSKERSDMQVQEIQKNLEKSEIRFRQIVETAIEGILIFDKDYKITFANKNVAFMLGYTVDEMIGKPYIVFSLRINWVFTAIKSSCGKKVLIPSMNVACGERTDKIAGFWSPQKPCWTSREILKVPFPC